LVSFLKRQLEADVANSEVKKVRHLKETNDTDYTRFNTRLSQQKIVAGGGRFKKKMYVLS